MRAEEWRSIYPDRFGELLARAGCDAAFDDPTEPIPMDILEAWMNEFDPIELADFLKANRN
jgi:hypothetical protein